MSELPCRTSGSHYRCPHSRRRNLPWGEEAEARNPTRKRESERPAISSSPRSAAHGQRQHCPFPTSLWDPVRLGAVQLYLELVERRLSCKRRTVRRLDGLAVDSETLGVHDKGTPSNGGLGTGTSRGPRRAALVHGGYSDALLMCSVEAFLRHLAARGSSPNTSTPMPMKWPTCSPRVGPLLEVDGHPAAVDAPRQADAASRLAHRTWKACGNLPGRRSSSASTSPGADSHSLWIPQPPRSKPPSRFDQEWYQRKDARLRLRTERQGEPKGRRLGQCGGPVNDSVHHTYGPVRAKFDGNAPDNSPTCHRLSLSRLLVIYARSESNSQDGRRHRAAHEAPPDSAPAPGIKSGGSYGNGRGAAQFWQGKRSAGSRRTAYGATVLGQLRPALGIGYVARPESGHTADDSAAPRDRAQPVGCLRFTPSIRK